MNKRQNESIRQFEKKQMVAAFLGLIVVMLGSIAANSLHLQSVAEQTTKFITRMVQLEDFREVGLTLEETRLSNFRRIQYISSRPGRSFALPEVSKVHQSSLWYFLSTDRVSFPTYSPLQPDISDKITYEYNRFRLIPHSIFIWLLLVLVSIPQTRFMKRKLSLQFEKEIQVERALAKADIAKQVKHNLRTPLAALMRIPSRLPDGVKTDRELLSSSIAQIRAITSALDGNEITKKISESMHVELYDTLKRSIHEISLIIPRPIQF